MRAWLNAPEATADVAVVVVVYNQLRDDCLPSLRRVIASSPLRVRAVVVDNASPTVDVASMVRAQLPQAVTVVRRDNAGFGAGSNDGARALCARAYLFLNPDTRMDDARMIDTLYAFLQRYERVGVVAPRTRYFDGSVQETCRRFPLWYLPFARRTAFASSPRGQVFERRFLMGDFDHATARMVDWVQGSAMMVRGELFHDMGGFDARYFMYFEDVDLCRQSWERGRPVYYVPDAEVLHAYAKDSARETGVVRGLMRNRLARAHVASWLRYIWKWGV